MTEELKQEFEEKFLTKNLPSHRYMVTNNIDVVWNWISDQIKQAKIEELILCDKKMFTPNLRLDDYIESRITELKQQKEK